MAAEHKTPIYDYLSANKNGNITGLLDNGASPNECHYPYNGDIVPILFYAIDTKHHEAINLLLAYGADINLLSKIGDTALHRALLSNDMSILKVIVNAKPQLDTNIWNHGTVLHEACRNGQLRAAKLLKEHGAKVNLTTDAGNTELHEAIRYGQPVMAHWLLKQEGIQVDAKNKEGLTPSDYSIKSDIPGISIEALEVCQLALNHKLNKVYGESKSFSDKYSKKSITRDKF